MTAEAGSVRLRQLINGTLNQFDQLVGDGTPTPVSDATRDSDDAEQAHRTNGHPWGRTDIDLAQAHIHLSAAAAKEHLTAIRALLDDEASMSARVLARAVLEVSGLCAWLVDPSLSLRDRVKRSLMVELRGLRDGAKAAADLGGSHAAVLSMQGRCIARLLHAEELGFEIVRDESGTPTGLVGGHLALAELATAAMPGVTESQAKAFYAYISGSSHSMPWFLMQHAQRPLATRASTSPGMAPEMFRDLLWAVDTALRTFLTMCDRYFSYFGWVGFDEWRDYVRMSLDEF